MQVGICLAVHFVDEDGSAIEKGARLHAELAAVADGAAHDAAQNVARARVGGQDAVLVADEHHRRARVVGDDAHRLARFLVLVVLLARNFFELLDDGKEEVSLIAVRKPVQKEEHPVEPEARIDVLVLERHITRLRLAVLHIDVVADLHIVVGEDGVFLLLVDGIEPLVVGAAGGADGALELPPVVALREEEDVLGPDAEPL